MFPDSALKLRTREVDVFDDFLAQLAHSMHETMAVHGGVGISANQVGFAIRMCLISSSEGVFTLINPTVEWASEETVEIEEGCLSIPGIYVPVVRPEKVSVQTFDLKGEEEWFDLAGDAARVVQHEIDHLDGVTMLDRTDDTHRRQALRTIASRLSAGIGIVHGTPEGFTEVPLWTPSETRGPAR